MRQALVTYGSSAEQAAASAPGEVFQMLQRQTSTLAYTDVFFIIGLLALTVAVAGACMSDVKADAGGGAG